MSYQCDPRCAEVMAERDALRTENEKLKGENKSLSTITFLNQNASMDLLLQIDTLKAQLAEAQEIIEWTARADGWSLGQGNAVIGKARGYLAKYKKQSGQ